MSGLDVCAVCTADQVQVQMVECGHQLCKSCSHRVSSEHAKQCAATRSVADPFPKCPFCRAPIKECVPIKECAVKTSARSSFDALLPQLHRSQMEEMLLELADLHDMQLSEELAPILAHLQQMGQQMLSIDEELGGQGRNATGVAAAEDRATPAGAPARNKPADEGIERAKEAARVKKERAKQEVEEAARREAVQRAKREDEESARRKATQATLHTKLQAEEMVRREVAKRQNEVAAAAAQRQKREADDAAARAKQAARPAVQKAPTLSGQDFNDGGVIFGCKNNTYGECMQRKLLGLPQQHLKMIQRITPFQTALFLFNYSKREMHGVFEAIETGGMNLDPDAWTDPGKAPPRRGMAYSMTNNRIAAAAESPYPAQVRFQVVHDFAPLPEHKFRNIVSYKADTHIFSFTLVAGQVAALMQEFMAHDKLVKAGRR